ncbi:hypothetical protein PSYMP_29405, partial [Pseudomonas amygdali pv. morsprunorum str. M302280]
AGSSRYISLASFILMVGSSTPLGNALFRRQNIGFAIHNKRAVDHHCWDLRDP